MTPGSALVVISAGMAAGVINTVVGSGTLITFPALLALGYPPVTANVSNGLGLVFGGLSGSWGYRRELRDQAERVRLLAPLSVIGSIIGALLVVRLPSSVFAAVVPCLILLALALILVQPIIGSWTARRARHRPVRPVPRRLLYGGILATGIYCGYFGAGQGIILLALLGTLFTENIQKNNALKNVLGTVSNLVSAITFLCVAFGTIDWGVAALIAMGSLLGGFLGASVGRRLPPQLFRGVVLAVGLLAVLRTVIG